MVRRHAGQRQEGFVACLEMPEHFPCTRWKQWWYPITPTSRFAALGRVEPNLVGLLGKALTRDATKCLRFIVLAAGCPHIMVLHGLTAAAMQDALTYHWSCWIPELSIRNLDDCPRLAKKDDKCLTICAQWLYTKRLKKLHSPYPLATYFKIWLLGDYSYSMIPICPTCHMFYTHSQTYTPMQITRCIWHYCSQIRHDRPSYLINRIFRM